MRDQDAAERLARDVVAGRVSWKGSRRPLPEGPDWGSGCNLLAGFAIDDDRHRAIVDEGDVHHGSKAALSDGFGKARGEEFTELLVERFGVVGFGGANEGGTISLFGAGVEGELADDEGVAIRREKGMIHASFLVFKDAHVGDLAREPLGIDDLVVLLDAEEDEKAGVDFGDDLALDGDGCFGDSLDHCAHTGVLAGDTGSYSNFAGLRATGCR